MDKYTAARLLGVAAYTVEKVEAEADGWYATVRDMSTHGRTRRLVPGAQPPAEPDVDSTATRPAAAKPTKKAPPKSRKAAG